MGLCKYSRALFAIEEAPPVKGASYDAFPIVSQHGRLHLFIQRVKSRLFNRPNSLYIRRLKTGSLFFDVVRIYIENVRAFLLRFARIFMGQLKNRGENQMIRVRISIQF